MKSFIAGATALACLALPAAAAATHSGGQGPKQDFAQGTGHADLPQFGQIGTFHVNAKSGPGGEDARGHVRLEILRNGALQAELRGRVTCLNVAGNRAVVGAEIERGEAAGIPDIVGTGAIFEFEDNGSGSDAPPDRSNAGLVGTPPEVCPPPPVVAVLPFGQGNFVVHDAIAP